MGMLSWLTNSKDEDKKQRAAQVVEDAQSNLDDLRKKRIAVEDRLKSALTEMLEKGPQQ